METRRSQRLSSSPPRSSSASHGFSSEVSLSRPYSISVLFGPTGAQKSSTVFLYWPEPVYTLNFDGGRDIPAFQRARNTCSICGLYTADHEEEDGDHALTPISIFRSELSSSIDFDKLDRDAAIKEGKKQVESFWTTYDYALDKVSSDKRPGTICIDTFGELKPRLCASIIGSSEIPFKQIRAQGRLNQICREIVNKARERKVHLVILARESEIWKNDKSTGSYKPKVPPALLEAVDWAGYIEVNVEKGRRGKAAIVTPSITMFKCGGNSAEQFAVYTPDDWGDNDPFAHICYNQWIDSKLKDWRK